MFTLTFHWLFIFCYYMYTLILVEKTQVEPEIQTLYRLMNCKSKDNFVIYPCRMHLWFVCYSNVIYATDVGFKVGGDSDIKYLVLQVHYKNVDNFLPPSKYCMDTSQKYCQSHPEIVQKCKIQVLYIVYKNSQWSLLHHILNHITHM